MGLTTTSVSVAPDGKAELSTETAQRGAQREVRTTAFAVVDDGQPAGLKEVVRNLDRYPVVGTNAGENDMPTRGERRRSQLGIAPGKAGKQGGLGSSR
jgi:hypothetical protein